MNRRLMLLTAVVSMLMLTIPSISSAQEIHVEGGTTFSGSGGAASFAATGEPTITCEASLNSGSINSGGTTGFLGNEYLGCHATVLGFTVQCHTPDGLKNNEIHQHGSFHFVTISSSKPAMLVTSGATEVICAGISNTRIEGNLIGTITSPACGASSSFVSVSFSSTGSTQDHRSYTGINYDLKAQTSGGSQLTAASSQNWTISTSSSKLSCT